MELKPNTYYPELKKIILALCMSAMVTMVTTDYLQINYDNFVPEKNPWLGNSPIPCNLANINKDQSICT